MANNNNNYNTYDNNKYTYGTGNEKETDAFIASLTNSVPKAAPDARPLVYNQQVQALVQSGRVENGTANSRTCTRLFLMFVSVCYLIGGAAMLALVLTKKDKETFISHCGDNNCKQTFNVVAGVFGFAAFVGLLGVVATCTRNKCLILTYCFLQAICFIVFLAWTVLVIFTTMSAFDGILEKGWKHNVNHSPSVICDIEETLECSGWKHSCAPQNATAAPTEEPTATPTSAPTDAPTAIPTTTPVQLAPQPTTMPADCAVCPNRPADNMYTTTCHDAVHTKFHKYFVTFLIVGIAGTLVSLVTCIAMWKARARAYRAHYEVIS